MSEEVARASGLMSRDATSGQGMGTSTVPSGMATTVTAAHYFI